MLRVSRDFINQDVITNYPVDKRFIKLPIEAYLKLLKVRKQDGTVSTAFDELNRPQIAIINAINDPRIRFVVAAISRRLGKTFISNIIAQLVMLVPGSHVLVVSPNFSLSSISFELQRQFIRQFDLEIAKDNVKDRIIELANGSTVRMGSVSTIDATVGRSYDLIVFDEAALSDKGEEAFQVSLRPTLDRVGSKAIFISTPRGKFNYFSKYFDRGFSDRFPEWCSIHADYTENVRMSASDVAEAKNSMSAAEFAQEYLASFTVFMGQIFTIDQSHIVEYERGDRDEAIAGLDPGYKDPTAFIVLVYKPSEDIYHIVDEYCEAEQTTSQHVPRFLELMAKWNVDAVYIDHSAAQFAADLAFSYDISTIKAKKDLLPGIAFVQSLIEKGRLRISPRCTKTIEALDQYQWDTRDTITKEKPVHKFSHIPDAIRYAIYTYIP